MAEVVGDAARQALEQEVQRFLFQEAWLLDEGRIHEWVALFTDDARYWMPVTEIVENETAATDLALPIFDDDKAFLELRAKRLDTGLAHAERPRSRTRRLISNVWIDEVDGEELTAHSNFIVFQGTRDRGEDFYVGSRIDRLRRVKGGFRIAGRKIVLEHRILPRTLSILF